MTDYLDLIREDQQVEIKTRRGPVTIARARLGTHLQLARVFDRMSEAIRDGNVEEASRQLLRYVDLCGLQPEGLGAVGLLDAFLQLVGLNQVRHVFPFMLPTGGESERPPYHYGGRVFATWVHRLASAYGWTRQEIMGLWPEEVGAYLQELEVQRYEDMDERRSLTELGYHYDEHTKKSRFIPVVRPAWMVEGDNAQSRRAPSRVPRRLVPQGLVVDLSGMEEERLH